MVDLYTDVRLEHLHCCACSNLHVDNLLLDVFSEKWEEGAGDDMGACDGGVENRIEIRVSPSEGSVVSQICESMSIFYG